MQLSFDATSHEASNRSVVRPAVGTSARVIGAMALVVGGLVHLQLYFHGYRYVPDANLGRSFLADAIASALIAALVATRRDVLVRLAAVGLAAGSLGAFWMSRTRGIFGFTETGLQPSPQAALALVAETVALVALALTFVPRLGAGSTRRVSTTAAALTLVALVTVGAGLLFAHQA